MYPIRIFSYSLLHNLLHTQYITGSDLPCGRDSQRCAANGDAGSPGFSYKKRLAPFCLSERKKKCLYTIVFSFEMVLLVEWKIDDFTVFQYFILLN